MNTMNIQLGSIGTIVFDISYAISGDAKDPKQNENWTL